MNFEDAVRRREYREAADALKTLLPTAKRAISVLRARHWYAPSLEGRILAITALAEDPEVDRHFAEAIGEGAFDGDFDVSTMLGMRKAAQAIQSALDDT